MTPRPSPHRARRVPRSAALLAAVLLIAGAPLVARALGDDAPSPSTAAGSVRPLWFELDGPVPAPAPTPTPSPSSEPEPTVGPAAETATDVTLDPAVARQLELVRDTYEWDERSPRVEQLQAALGLPVDGWYAHATRLAHLGALAFWELPTDAVPAVVVPAGPSPSEWAALRDCESGGDYTITNPSGRYRGAYQFDRSTWDSVAGRHAPHLIGVDPAAASPTEQDAMAAALYGERGARPWPHCGRHLS